MLQKKKSLLEKIVKKDYNNELEEVLEKKQFDENVKSTLLGILYKNYSSTSSCGDVPIFNSSSLSFVIKTSLGLLPWYPDIIPLSSI